MSDNGKVSTEDTPKDRPANVISSENQNFDTQKPTATPDDQSGQNSENGDSEDNTKDTDKQGGSQRRQKRRIDKLTKELTQVKTQLNNQSAEKDAQIEALQAELAQFKQSSHANSKPKRDDFDSDEDFAEAYSDWKSSSKTPAKKAEPAKKPGQSTTPYDELIEEVVTAGADKHDDWSTIWQEAPMNKEMAMALFEEDDPELIADVAIYLHETFEESAKTFKESNGKPRTAAKRMDAIIEKVKAKQAESDQDGEENTQKPSKSEPPEPANHLSTGGNDGGGSTKITGKEGMADYVAKRKKQEAEKRRL